ncbi:unnamed protein product [Fraxinus pennsylvanica]|uniref:Uncharacterized protein n=1 Tax=Fraxinus pennsylvanica TaxID=56036 RepID=A0AAD1YNU7_9LAMI|nr:unnamed protein product [Fraxinus pennsylvanica]
MEEEKVDYVLVPLGMGILLAYHVWLLFMIVRNPRRTVIGLNAESRQRWVHCLMTDPLKNGVLAVQTLRNNIMASTLLATTAITLVSLISVYVSNKSNSPSLELVYVPTFKDRKDAIEYVVINLNRGSFFWSVGLRAFYFSFPLFLWVFGPIPMFVCCCILSFILYFLDTTTNFTRNMHNHSIKDEAKADDLESILPST